MTTVMKATGSADFLGLVPVLAGYAPTRSIVLLPFEGKRTYGAMRLDLPEDDDLECFVERAAELISRVDRVDAVAMVIYCDDEAVPTNDGLVLPYAVLADRLLDALEDAGLGIIDALCAMPGGWSSYLDDDPRMRPLPPVRPDAEGETPGDQNDGAEAPAVDLAEKERVGRALIGIRELMQRMRDDQPLDAARTDPRAIAAVALLDDLPLFAELALRAESALEPFETAALLWTLSLPVFRDAVLMQWITDLENGDDALASQLAYAAEGALPPHEHGRMLIGTGPRPDMARLRRALELSRALIARAPKADRVGPLAIAAWLCWALGRSTHAARHLAELRAIDPDYSFAHLLGTLMAARPLPEWLFRSRAADAA